MKRDQAQCARNSDTDPRTVKSTVHSFPCVKIQKSREAKLSVQLNSHVRKLSINLGHNWKQHSAMLKRTKLRVKKFATIQPSTVTMQRAIVPKWNDSLKNLKPHNANPGNSQCNKNARRGCLKRREKRETTTNASIQEFWNFHGGKNASNSFVALKENDFHGKRVCHRSNRRSNCITVTVILLYVSRRKQTVVELPVSPRCFKLPEIASTNHEIAGLIIPLYSQ